jgi:Domain of unknown function (DUF5710)
MGRIYLYVPFEEQEQVKTLGAQHDHDSKCWYIDSTMDPEPFKPWLGNADDEEEEYAISSDHAYVACAKSVCWKCHSDIEVIAIYCEKGISDEEEIRETTISNITAIDAALSMQLERWPQFRKESAEDCFANYCPHCGAMQEDTSLHEPDGVFFSIAAGSVVTLRPLTGLIRLNGDESYEVADEDDEP